MNAILDEILGHIRQVKDDKQKLQKILDFILEEIYEATEEELLEIPEQLEKNLMAIAQSIDAGFITHINLDTFEIEDLPPDMEDPENYELRFKDCSWATEPKFYNWENVFRITPLHSSNSFKIMDEFADEMEDAKFQLVLYNALNHRKPFSNFKWKVENSPYRQNWYDFKQQWLENYVRQIIWSKLNSNKN